MLDTLTPDLPLHGPTRLLTGRMRRCSIKWQCPTNLVSKRVFLLFPSHHHYLRGAATTACNKYATPIGDLSIDISLVKKIQEEWGLDIMERSVDEDEHSSEMHLPYIHKMLSLYVSSRQLHFAC